MFKLEYTAEEHIAYSMPLAREDGKDWKVNARDVASLSFIRENGYIMLTVCGAPMKPLDMVLLHGGRSTRYNNKQNRLSCCSDPKQPHLQL